MRNFFSSFQKANYLRLFLFEEMVLWAKFVKPCLRAPRVTPSPTKMLVTPMFETCRDSSTLEECHVLENNACIITQISTQKPKSGKRKGSEIQTIKLSYRFNVPILIIKKEHGLERHPCPPMYPLEMLCLVRPTGEDLLQQQEKKKSHNELV